jgi:hypothetical protein
MHFPVTGNKRSADGRMRHAEAPESKTPDYIGTKGKIKQVSEVRNQESAKNPARAARGSGFRRSEASSTIGSARIDKWWNSLTRAAFRAGSVE